MNLKLNPVMKNHWDFIMELRNDFYEKYFFEQNQPLTKIQHYEYMKKQASNPNFFQWIVVGNNDQLIGYIRILEHDINIMVHRNFQNKGFGTKILELVEDKAKKLGLKKLQAKVIHGNHSSKKIFEKNDFKHKMDFLEKKL